MGLLRAFRKYTAYFHDGDVFDVYQKTDQIVFWMESAQIPPEEMVDDFALTNISTLRGRLHLEGVKCIYENDNAIDKINKQYEIGNIYDFEIKDNLIVILITWKTDLTRPRESSDMIEYKIHAEKIYWENLPTSDSPIKSSISDYQKYFENGEIFRMQHINDEIRVVVESVPIPNVNDKTFGFTNKNTLIGELLLTWIKNITVNGHPCSRVEPIIGEGEILKFNIGYHRMQLEVCWLSVTNGTSMESPLMNIDVECGSIDIRPI